MKRLIPLVMVVLVAASCSSDSDSAATTETPPTSTTTTTTTTTTPTTVAPTTSTPSQLPDVSLPDVNIDDARDALRLIFGFIDDLSRNPQPELLDLYYDPECSTYPTILSNFTELVENGWRYAGLEATELRQMLPVFQNDDDAQIVATYRIAPDEVYDAEGNLVREDPEQILEKGFYLTRSDELGWRICEVLEVGGG